MSFYALIYTLCAVEFVDILDFLSDDVKTILMFLIAVVSIIIQIVRAVKGNRNKSDIEKVMDTIYDKLKGDKKAVENKEEVNNMYEVQMSPLVEKICNIYAQENGLNYPPCTQQMLNAVTEWLNNNAIEDIQSVTSQLSGGNTVTLTITYTHPDGSTKVQTISFDVPVVNGKDGTNGVDGVSIERFAHGVPYVAGGDTVTPITVYYNDGNHGDFSVIAKNGTDGTNGTNGTDGNGIVSVHSLGHSTVGRETITNVEVVTDNGNQTFEVHALNGVDGVNRNIGVTQVTLHPQPTVPVIASMCFFPEGTTVKVGDLLLSMQNNELQLAEITEITSSSMYTVKLIGYCTDNSPKIYLHIINLVYNNNSEALFILPNTDKTPITTTKDLIRELAKISDFLKRLPCTGTYTQEGQKDSVITYIWADSSGSNNNINIGYNNPDNGIYNTPLDNNLISEIIDTVI